ncbi:MAG: hypothetical protein M0P00_08780, partial [Bacteroidaceae bacterium]|nr:hypothetical protein [Bacteroidaceae bacterium]
TFAKEGTQVDVNAAFVDGLKELAGSVNQFMKNRYDIYDIVIKVADEIMPKKVIDSVGIFAEVQVVPQNQKAMFKKKMGRARAKKFLTQVGLSGVYETFRLDTTTFELAAHAVGGGATIDFERMLDSAESIAEVMDVITEGLIDAVFLEVQKALRAALNATNRPSTNKYSANSFNAGEMVKLINVVRSYGDGVVIFAPPEFVGAMGPDVLVPAIAGAAQGVYHPQDLDAIHNTGFINLFRGTPIVQIPQSFIDENNEKTWIDPQMAYILPTGGEKVVKVVLEGATQINDFKNRDNSMEVFAYKKMGCGILTHHNWAICQNTGIVQTYENPYGI